MNKKKENITLRKVYQFNNQINIKVRNLSNYRATREVKNNNKTKTKNNKKHHTSNTYNRHSNLIQYFSIIYCNFVPERSLYLGPTK